MCALKDNPDMVSLTSSLPLMTPATETQSLHSTILCMLRCYQTLAPGGEFSRKSISLALPMCLFVHIRIQEGRGLEWGGVRWWKVSVGTLGKGLRGETAEEKGKATQKARATERNQRKRQKADWIEKEIYAYMCCSQGIFVAIFLASFKKTGRNSQLGPGKRSMTNGCHNDVCELVLWVVMSFSPLGGGEGTWTQVFSFPPRSNHYSKVTGQQLFMFGRPEYPFQCWCFELILFWRSSCLKRTRTQDVLLLSLTTTHSLHFKSS